MTSPKVAASRRHDRTSAAIDALADLYDHGHLLASSEPDKLLMLAVEEIKRARAEVAVAPLLATPEPEQAPAAPFDEAIVAAYLAVPEQDRGEYRRIRREWAETDGNTTDPELIELKASGALVAMGLLSPNEWTPACWEAINPDEHPDDWREVLAACEQEEDRRTALEKKPC